MIEDMGRGDKTEATGGGEDGESVKEGEEGGGRKGE